jgi:hypothetical protein
MAGTSHRYTITNNVLHDHDDHDHDHALFLTESLYADKRISSYNVEHFFKPKWARMPLSPLLSLAKPSRNSP